VNIVKVATSTAGKVWVSRLFPLGWVRTRRDQWEAEYAGGGWERLRRIDELPHYSAIAGYAYHFADSGRVLDVGCGVGILQEVLGRDRYGRYLGIDLAQDAIQQASAKQDEQTAFEQGDAASYTPREEFDVVVFNEVLYYFDAPLDVMARYAPGLADGGVTIVSMVVDRRTLRIWRMLERSHTPEASVLVASRSASWVVKAYRGGFGRGSGDQSRA
jgi:2-polyprenyl-3-methyl-5-hydroxy-6-metoxy-1,4-benzoquinol methylase